MNEYKGNDGIHQPDFAERRIEAFAKSIDGKWIYRLKNDDDDETNWYFLTEEIQEALNNPHTL